MLHNICMSAVAMSGERTVARGPLVSSPELKAQDEQL